MYEELHETFTMEIEATPIIRSRKQNYSCFSGFESLTQCIATGIAGLKLIAGPETISFVNVTITLPDIDNLPTDHDNIFDTEDLEMIIRKKIQPSQQYRNSQFWRTRSGIMLSDWIDLMRTAIHTEIPVFITFICEDTAVYEIQK